MEFRAYHGVTAGEHQASFEKLSGLGYRIISLSVYGDPGDTRYAAVWVQRSGPAWVAVHGVDAVGYQTFFNTHTAQGYAPVLVSATGASGNATFAAVFEQGGTGAWVARHGMISGLATQVGTFQYQDRAAAEARMVLRSVAIYGSAADRRYAAVWQANPNYVKCHVHPADTASAYQMTFRSGDAATRLSARWLPARLRRAVGQPELLFGVQGRCRGHLGRAARLDWRRVPEGIRRSERRVLPDLRAGRWRGRRHAVRGDLREARPALGSALDCRGDAGARAGCDRPHYAGVHEGERRARRAAGRRQERRAQARARLHVGRAWVSRDQDQRSVPARELQQDVPGGGGAVAVRRRQAHPDDAGLSVARVLEPRRSAQRQDHDAATARPHRGL